MGGGERGHRGEGEGTGKGGCAQAWAVEGEGTGKAGHVWVVEREGVCRQWRGNGARVGMGAGAMS